MIPNIEHEIEHEEESKTMDFAFKVIGWIAGIFLSIIGIWLLGLACW